VICLQDIPSIFHMQLL